MPTRSDYSIFNAFWERDTCSVMLEENLFRFIGEIEHLDKWYLFMNFFSTNVYWEKNMLEAFSVIDHRLIATK